MVELFLFTFPFSTICCLFLHHSPFQFFILLTLYISVLTLYFTHPLNIAAMKMAMKIKMAMEIENEDTSVEAIMPGQPCTVRH